jgi:virulence factor Mce-like protein
MKRILLSAAILLAAGAFAVLAGGASNGGNANGTYKIELDNAFGLVTGADFKVAGVRAGTIKSIDLNETALHANKLPYALVTVQVTQPGFGSFRSDVFCQSRPQSLIGEYFIECQPGQSGTVLKPGSTIPVTRTQSTIPADLLQNVMRMPYRQRFTLIINELGAAVAGRSGDLQAALQRAVPALTQTDNLLNLLANDSGTLQALTANSDAVITALANNSTQVQRFITEANNAATDTATQQTSLKATFHKLPAFFEQLRPALAKLGAATDANQPVLANLNGAASQLNRLFTDLPSFSRSAQPALKSLGQASVTGKTAVQAAGPTITHLNQFAKPTPELAQNLAIVLRDLDSRSRAVEPDPRSPGGQGYTGLEALLQYVFNQTLAINTFSTFGHELTVDAFVDVKCTPYATPGTIAMNLKSFGAAYRKCYSWLGPNQQGVNIADPSNPGGAVPDPGGSPPGLPGPTTNARKLTVADVTAANAAATKATRATTKPTTTWTSSGSGSKGGPVDLGKTVGQILSLVGGAVAPASPPSSPSSGSRSPSSPSSGARSPGSPSSGSSSSGSTPPASGSTTTTPSSGAPPSNLAQQLLNYLLSP